MFAGIYLAVHLAGFPYFELSRRLTELLGEHNQEAVIFKEFERQKYVNKLGNLALTLGLMGIAGGVAAGFARRADSIGTWTAPVMGLIAGGVLGAIAGVVVSFLEDLLPTTVGIYSGTYRSVGLLVAAFAVTGIGIGIARRGGLLGAGLGLLAGAIAGVVYYIADTCYVAATSAPAMMTIVPVEPVAREALWAVVPLLCVSLFVEFVEPTAKT